jgi:hypothetical protein
MMTVEEIETEVVVEGHEAPHRESPPPTLEARKDQLRAVVRELLEEELARFLRTEVRP